MKTEPANSRNPQLKGEYDLYRWLAGANGIPNVHYLGVHHGCNTLVMDLLGKSLEDLFQARGQRFSLKTVLMLADQLVARLEHVHNKDYLHRDIKSENFMVGHGSRNDIVYIIDFGLSKKYVDSRKRHMAYREGRDLIGTPRFVSINTHLGKEQSRRDDMEALGHMMLYFLRGSLPWQGLPAPTVKEKYAKIRDKKINTSLQELCHGFPIEFATYMKYVRALRFEERPDYAYLRNMFRSALERHGFQYDYVFDWVTGPGRRVSRTSRASKASRSRGRRAPSSSRAQRTPSRARPRSGGRRQNGGRR